MCEYQRINPNTNLLECICTKQLCTLCVLGNFDTYNKQKESEKFVRKGKNSNEV